MTTTPSQIHPDITTYTGEQVPSITVAGHIKITMDDTRSMELQEILLRIHGIEQVHFLFRNPDIIVIRFVPSTIHLQSIHEIMNNLGHPATIVDY